MNISLTNELEDFVKAQVASGHYASASEVIREALRGYIHASMECQLEKRLELSRKVYEAGDAIVADGAYFNRKIQRIKDKQGSQ